jgi:hypothetical protein
MSQPIANRPSLGGLISIFCFKSVITGMEEALGEKATAVALIVAGRDRGKNLAKSLGLSDSTTIATQSNQAVGEYGTRLNTVDRIVQDGDLIKVSCAETVCAAGEAGGSSRKCTFTMGVVWSALSEITGKKLRGIHTESVLRGGTHDLLEFSVVE